MRHGKRFNHLGRTAAHRKAMLSNMASSLFVHKRINTTLAKAKALRRYVEPLITKAKSDTTHSRRVAFSYLQDKESVKALFNEVVDRIANRPGGYTRIIKLGTRLGDNAEMAMIELVDFNDLLIQEAEPKKTKTRRSRRGGSKAKKETGAEGAETKEQKDVKAGDKEPSKTESRKEEGMAEIQEPPVEEPAEQQPQQEPEGKKEAAADSKKEEDAGKTEAKTETEGEEVKAAKSEAPEASGTEEEAQNEEKDSSEEKEKK